MNIESTTATLTKPQETTSSASTTTATAVKDDNTKSFKEELENTAKTQETKTTKENQTAEEVKKADSAEGEQEVINQKTAEDNLTQTVNKNQLTNEKETQISKTKNENKTQNTDKDPLEELSSELETLSSIKNNSSIKTQGTISKTEELSDKNDYCKTIKMDNNDITFFVNLVENQQMTVQTAQAAISNENINNNFTEIKTEATQQTVQVSQTLLNSLNEAMKTNKPLRIDFGSDIAVIMKVDKDGVLSANFIPGSSAVENYLRNNIAGLQQNFENQNLPYNELTYSKQQKQEQQEKQNNNKEKKDE